MADRMEQHLRNRDTPHESQLLAIFSRRPGVISLMHACNMMMRYVYPKGEQLPVAAGAGNLHPMLRCPWAKQGGIAVHGIL